VEFDTKTLKIEDYTIKAQMWDTAGQERFRAVTSNYYKGALGALLVFDVTRPGTFKNMERWYNEIKQHANENIVLLLIGNKSDLRADGPSEEVRVEDAKAFAQSHGMAYMETSAKSGSQVNEAFEKLVRGKNSLVSSL
jgi:small GTP-binding protein